MSSRAVLFFAFVVLLGAPVAAQETRDVERLIRRAEDTLNSNSFNQGLRYLDQADAKLAKLSDEAQAALRPKIAEVRAALTETKRAHDETQLIKRVERLVGESSLKSNFTNKRWEGIRRKIKDAETLLQSEEGKVLGAEGRATCEAMLVAAREKLATTLLEDAVADVERYLERVEAIASGEDRSNFWGNRFERSYEEAGKELKEVPASDPRATSMAERLQKARVTFDAAVVNLKQAALIQGIQAVWAEYSEGRYAARSVGWEAEQGVDYAEWISSQSTIGLEKTEAHYHLAVRMLKDQRYLDALEKLPDAPEVQKVAQSVQDQLETAARKHNLLCNTLLEGAERDGEIRHTDLTYAVDRLVDRLERIYEGAPGRAVTLGRARELIAGFEDLSLGDAKIRTERWSSCIAASDESWPEFADAFSNAEAIVPQEATDDPEAWAGREVRIEAPNHAGWDYHPGDYDHVPTVDGLPVACVLDPGLKEAIEAMESQSGLTFSTVWISDVVGIVEASGTVKTLQGEEITAPTVRVVALKAGPFALAAGVGSNFSKVDDLEDVGVSAEGVSAGLSMGWLCLGFACCMVTIVLVGGGGFYAYSRQKAGAAGATPAAAPAAAAAPPAAPPAAAAPPPAAAPPAAAAPPPAAAPPAAAPPAAAPPPAPPAAEAAPPPTPPAPPAAPPPPPAAPPPPPAP